MSAVFTAVGFSKWMVAVLGVADSLTSIESILGVPVRTEINKRQ
jgi:hypothetical protein